MKTTRSQKAGIASITSAAIAAALAFTGAVSERNAPALLATAVAAPRVCDDGGRPPCNKPSGEAAANNLSFPLILPEGVRPPGWVEVTSWLFAPITATTVCVGENDIVPPNTVDPNVLCYFGRENLGIDEVTGEPVLTGSPKLWWLQQRTANRWQAYNVSDPNLATAVAVTAIDWGDLLESAGTLSQKQVRTEMILYKNVDNDSEFNPEGAARFGTCVDETSACFAAFKMSGAVPGTDQSIAEIQGADYGPGPDVGDVPGTRALIDPREVRKDAVTGVGFDATIYSTCARLVIQKVTGDPATLVWDPTGGQWSGPAVNNPVVDITAQTGTYSAEINAGGALLYGHNWNTKTASEGSGAYRLTFVLDGPTSCSGSNAVFDSNTIIANPGNLNFATLVTQGDAALNGGDEGGLTYIDVTVKITGGGGGGGGGGPGPGGQ